MITIESVLHRLMQPAELLAREDAIGPSGSLPRDPGVYGWYFPSSMPPGVPVDGCHEFHGSRLLYVGIAPSRPGGKSKQKAISSRSANPRRILRA